MFITFASIRDCAIASALVFRAYLERQATVWDSINGVEVAPSSLPADDRYAYRMMAVPRRNGVRVADPETMGATIGWDIPQKTDLGLWSIQWPDWADAALLLSMPAGGSVVASVNILPRQLGDATVTQDMINQIKNAVFGPGGASKDALIFEDGWLAATPLARHQTIARALGKPEVAALVAQEWVQPEAAGEVFDVGARVTHNGEVWESVVPLNVAEPGTKGWVKV